MSFRIALGLSYHGGGYHGWQSQPSRKTVQDHLERALACMAAEPVRTLCAGRTDAGVHGVGQVVHFDTHAQRAPFSWVRGTNAYLPPDIAVQWAMSVPAEFHARACALSRRYVYVVLDSPVRPSLEQGRVGWSLRPLQEQPMREATSHLLGTHDFSAFRASACQALSPVKHLQRVEISRCGPYWCFEFEANAFLHHMIRNIMGCLLYVGQGQRSPDWMLGVLQSCSREAAAPTFAPDGLYFVGPRYAPHWGLPDAVPGLDWLPCAAVPNA